MPPIKVMIVDDSAVVRQVLSATLGEDHAIEVIGAVVDPVFALERMKACWPDVIVLDVEMPRMDGITFLRKIMAERPTPVVICSTLTEKGSETALQALSAGAVCQNILIAAHAMGFVGNWLTEWYAYHPKVKEKIGLKPGERMAGFIYIGTSTVDLEERPRPEMDKIVQYF
mgnify:CR=1 FL=1